MKADKYVWMPSLPRNFTAVFCLFENHYSEEVVAFHLPFCTVVICIDLENKSRWVGSRASFTKK